jgi:phage FluMu protein Com
MGESKCHTCKHLFVARKKGQSHLFRRCLVCREMSEFDTVKECSHYEPHPVEEE